ncbi:hypothetical protein K1719_012308 [Acacia pycnantha]|nr:hypothetical protein K1719_012308 [Acacia pycnantha]
MSCEMRSSEVAHYLGRSSLLSKAMRMEEKEDRRRKKCDLDEEKEVCKGQVVTRFDDVNKPTKGIIVDLSNPMCLDFILNNAEKEKLLKPFQRTLIMKLLVVTPSYEFLHKKFVQIWAKAGQIRVFNLPDDFYLVKAHFNPREEVIDRIVAWIRYGHVKESCEEALKLQKSKDKGASVEGEVSVERNEDETKEGLKKESPWKDFKGLGVSVGMQGKHGTCKCSVNGKHEQRELNVRSGSQPRNGALSKVVLGYSVLHNGISRKSHDVEIESISGINVDKEGVVWEDELRKVGRPLLNKETKEAFFFFFFCMGPSKVPGDVEYQAVFYQKNWDVVGISVCNPLSSSTSPAKTNPARFKRPTISSASRRHKKLRGVRHRPWGHWAVEIQDLNLEKWVWLGTFDMTEEAAFEYNKAYLKIKGPNVVTNFLSSVITEDIATSEAITDESLNTKGTVSYFVTVAPPSILPHDGDTARSEGKQ